MKAVVFDRHGGPEVLELREVADPVAAPGEVVLDVRACGLNHLDLWVRAGLPGLVPEMPHILGSDVVGEIRTLGEGVSGWSVGDPVWVHPTLSCGRCEACRRGDDQLCRNYDVLGRKRQGGYAEQVAVPAANLFHYPERLAWHEAAAMPLVFLTAWHMLVGRARVQPGEDVLVIGAGSGVGSAAIQIASHLGARVIATSRDPAKLERAQALGAQEVIDLSREDLTARARGLTGNKGVDVVIEHVGGTVLERCVAALARDGRLVTCGATSGARVSLDANLLFGRHLALLGSWMGNRAETRAVLEPIQEGALQPVVDSVWPLAEARAAHERLAAGQHFGKLVLRT